MISLLPQLTAAAQAVPVAAEPTGLNYLQLILHASLPVQIVMLLLVAASVLSWFVIFGKSKLTRAAASAHSPMTSSRHQSRSPKPVFASERSETSPRKTR